MQKKEDPKWNAGNTMKNIIEEKMEFSLGRMLFKILETPAL